MRNNTISIVIGSWGSYNACNSRALGSKWLDLADYDEWEEIEEELKKNKAFSLTALMKNCSYRTLKIYRQMRQIGLENPF